MSNYRPDIDGLRAIAVLPVVFFHAQVPGFGGGFVGVDVFFVISGYLITQLIASEVQQGTFSYLNFWGRRVRRLLPAILFVTAACVIGGYLLYLPEQLVALGQSVGFLTVFASNIYFWLEAGYFEAPADSVPLLHTWSLAVEEQFYLFFPMVLMTLHRFVRSRLVTGITVLAGISLLISVFQVSQAPSAAYFLLPSRAWELLIGSLLALGIAGGVRYSPAVADTLILLGLVMIGVTVVGYSHDTPFPGLAAIVPCFGTALVLHAGGQSDGRVRRALGIAPLVFFGRLSFSLYLWHWPLLALWSILNQKRILAMGPIDIIAVVAASVLMAWISLQFIEEPVRRLRVLKSKTSLWLMSALCLGALGAFAIAAHMSGGFPDRVPVAVHKIAAASGDRTERQVHCSKKSPQQVVDGDLCVLGLDPKTASRKFLLWGDSHAQSILPVVDAAAKPANATGVIVSTGACPPVLGIRIADANAARKCHEQNAAVMQLHAAQGFDVIVLASMWTGNRVWDGERRIWPVNEQFDSLPVEELFAQQLRYTIEWFSERGAQVILLEEVPFPIDYHPWRAARSVWWGTEVASLGLPMRVWRERNAEPSALFDSLQDTGLRRINPTDYFCANGFCPAVVDGESQYSDGNHLTPSSSHRLRDAFVQALR